MSSRERRQLIFYIHTRVYKNELGLKESGLSNPSRRSRQPLLGACDLHFVAVGDSVPPLHSVTTSRRLLPPCLSTNSYEKNELGLKETGLSNPSQSIYRIMVKTVSSRVLEASLIVPPLRRSIWRERLSPTPVPALPLVVKNGTKSCS